jgi:4-methyl-5(b-hydroxyethyl)-thiazole monophosphate biosynthesis
MVYVFLAEGFEEVEAVAPVDILRRAGIEVETVAVTEQPAGCAAKTVRGAHGMMLTADIAAGAVKNDFDMVVLPGGPGTRSLEKSAVVRRCLNEAVARGAYIGAICAAPSILGHMGLLRGKRAVCYPGYEDELEGAKVMSSQTCEDGRIITGNGPGAAFAFGYLLAKRLGGDDNAVKSGMLYTGR